MGVHQAKAVEDRAVAFNVALTTLGVLTAAAAFAMSLVPPGGWLLGMRVLAACLAVGTAVVGFFKFRNERAFKRQQEDERLSLDQALKAESRRTALLINGAMLGTADKLRRLSMLDQATKDAEISAFRTSIVSKVCDLVQSAAPRAAYFRVQDLSARSRVMQSGPYSDSRNREDSFTSEFLEGRGGDQGVGDLIDTGDVELSNDTDTAVPASWDATKDREYRSFVSVAVRAESVGFGMLTANTLEADGFSNSDVASIKVLAHLLAAAEATTMTPARIAKAV
ncbi:hypothetical protein MMUR_28230 [Mycolicibacterium murale]|uniref:GAF domain-containing protein n=1 Tax=Mycolicibacterium murale TaxID=182220 RepID=A0A7I9WN90_9MYCO|nr:hypothetical protein [Mycolicibacterium murale]MCV7181281.1 hypothetical protein [Mycolicibacterium murale]GFG58687.1 hypothetical protein MMUR_28230 [Mycolicibacterium murale]